jgi:hypothetical protein
VDPCVWDRLLCRGRRHQPAAHRAHGVPDADRAAVVLAVGHEEGQGVLAVHPGPRGRDDRCVHLARPVPLLRVLGRNAHPDVFPDRDLGLRPARLRRRQVHPLYDGWQRAHAGRHPGPRVDARRGARRHLHLRPAEALRPRDPGAHAVLVLPRVRARIRDQGAAVPVSHLAARRPRRGADRGLDHPRWCAAQDGHVRADPVRVPAVPGGGRILRALHWWPTRA